MKEKAKKIKIKTNAERQKKYRIENLYRINSVVSSDAAIYLKLIAKKKSITKKKALETVIQKYFEEMISKMTESEIDDLYQTLET